MKTSDLTIAGAARAKSRRHASPLLSLLFVGALTACDRSPEVAGPLNGKITIDGSSTVLPLAKAMVEAFRQTNPGVQFAVDFAGTGGGFKKFCAGQLDIADASRPINATESEQCKSNHIEYREVPIAFDSLSVVVNAKNTFVDCLTVPELKAIWQPSAAGKITRWNQVRPSFPDLPLALFGPGKDSGTFDYFTLAVVGTESSSRDDYAKSEDDDVIERGVAGETNALGYFGYSYYQANKDKIKVVAIDNGHGCVVPSAQTVSDETYQPLTRPLFVYVNTAAAARPEVKAFVHFVLSPDSTKRVSTVGYVPLPVRSLGPQLARFDKGDAGSYFGGHGSVTGIGMYSFDDEERQRIRNALVR